MCKEMFSEIPFIWIVLIISVLFNLGQFIQNILMRKSRVKILEHACSIHFRGKPDGAGGHDGWSHDSIIRKGISLTNGKMVWLRCKVKSRCNKCSFLNDKCPICKPNPQKYRLQYTQAAITYIYINSPYDV